MTPIVTIIGVVIGAIGVFASFSSAMCATSRRQVLVALAIGCGNTAILATYATWLIHLLVNAP